MLNFLIYSFWRIFNALKNLEMITLLMFDRACVDDSLSFELLADFREVK